MRSPLLRRRAWQPLEVRSQRFIIALGEVVRLSVHQRVLTGAATEHDHLAHDVWSVLTCEVRGDRRLADALRAVAGGAWQYLPLHIAGGRERLAALDKVRRPRGR